MKPEFEFYYKTKYEDAILEKAAQEENKDAEKFAANLKDMAVVFAKKNPKAAEGAITGGILGAGSELFMPSRTDITGQPATNMGEIAKRGLLGATLGGVGGALKANVSKRISDIPMPKMAEENFDKIAGILDTLRAEPTRSAIKGGLIGASSGAVAGAGIQHLLNKRNIPKEEKTPVWATGLLGSVVGGAKGIPFGLDEGLYNQAKIVDNMADLTNSASAIKNQTSGKKYLPRYDVIRKAAKGVPEVLQKFAHDKEAGLLDLAAKIPTLQKSQLAGKAIQGISNVTGNIGTNGIMNTAGKYMVKNPRVGGAVLGAGAGLVGNTLSGSDHALGSTLAGAGLGALGGRSLLAGSLKKSPLLGKNFAAGAKSELSAIRAAKAPSSVNASSLQNAPPLSDLVAQSGVKVPQQTIPKITPGLSTPQKPQEMNFNS